MAAPATALSPIDPIQAAILRERARCLSIVLDPEAGRDCYTTEDWVGAHECCCWRSQLAAAIEEG